MNFGRAVFSLETPQIQAWTSRKGRGAVFCEDGTALRSSRDVLATVVRREGDGRAASRRLRALLRSVEFGLAAACLVPSGEGLEEAIFQRYLSVLPAFQSLLARWGCYEQIESDEAAAGCQKRG